MSESTISLQEFSEASYVDAVNDHYENFPVGSALISKDLRVHVRAIYAFARTADDFADEAKFAGKRMQLLSLWRQELSRCTTEKSSLAVFQSLGRTLRQTKMPIQWFHDLLDAFEQDVTKSRYQSFEELLDYSKKSANPIGRMILWLHDYRNEAAFDYSDSICTALQLTNFWQDVAVDANKDRVYLPKKEMDLFGYKEKELFLSQKNEAFENLLENLIKKTQILFERGRPLIDLVEGRLRYELRLTYCGGTRILEKIRRNDYDVFDQRPTLGAVDKVLLAYRSLISWKPLAKSS
ncbi:MAG: squalene synthase HpnC [Bdellovibrionota bacterium]